MQRVEASLSQQSRQAKPPLQSLAASLKLRRLAQPGQFSVSLAGLFSVQLSRGADSMQSRMSTSSSPVAASDPSAAGVPVAGASPDHPHRLRTKVYLEDTDAQGIVYHANYLKYCERSRTEILGQYGYTLGEMQARGTLFVVFEMRLRFLKPARLHDELEVVTTCQRTSEYRVVFQHKVFRHSASEPPSDPLFVAEAQVAAIDPEGELLELPEGFFA